MSTHRLLRFTCPRQIRARYRAHHAADEYVFRAARPWEPWEPGCPGPSLRLLWPMMWSVSYLYHLCADDFRGDELLPLNLLAARFPEIHDHEMRKWAGRESVIRFAVPHLGVTWGDTVNLAALDPSRLVEARRRLGMPFSSLLQRNVLRIPVERIAGQEAVVYDSRSHWRNSRPDVREVPEVPPDSDFTPFDPTTYEELTEIPPMHLDYLVEQRDAGVPALGFVFVRHVLVAGVVDVTGLARTKLA